EDLYGSGRAPWAVWRDCVPSRRLSPIEVPHIAASSSAVASGPMRELALGSGDLNVLCVGAHPDDIEIGCGATLLMLAKSRPARFTPLLLTGTHAPLAEAEHAAGLFVAAEVVAYGFPDGRLPAHWG